MGIKKIKGMGLATVIKEGYAVEANYRRIPREVRVGSEWEFPTLQDAVGELRSSSLSSRYTIKLANEEFEANVTLPPNVSIEGSGESLIDGTLTITSPTGRVSIQNVTIDVGSGVALQINSSSMKLTSCVINGNIQVNGVCDVEILRSVLQDGILSSTSASSQAVLLFGCLGNNFTFRRVFPGNMELQILYSIFRASGIYMTNATHKLQVTRSSFYRLDGSSTIQLEAGIANSYARISQSSIVSTVGVSPFAKTGGVGDLEVWTFHNGYSTIIGVGVHENIAVGYNVVDAAIAIF